MSTEELILVSSTNHILLVKTKKMTSNSPKTLTAPQLKRLKSLLHRAACHNDLVEQWELREYPPYNILEMIIVFYSSQNQNGVLTLTQQEAKLLHDAKQLESWINGTWEPEEVNDDTFYGRE